MRAGAPASEELSQESDGDGFMSIIVRCTHDLFGHYLPRPAPQAIMTIKKPLHIGGTDILDTL